LRIGIQSLIRWRFVSIYRKALSPKSAAKFFQVENQIQALVYLQIASEVPLVIKKLLHFRRGRFGPGARGKILIAAEKRGG